MNSFDRDEDPQRIPQSWADHGEREIAAADERRCYAIRAAFGVLEHEPSYRVPGNGTYPGDYRFEEQLEVLYVTPDLLRARAVRVDCEHEDGTVRPTDGWAAVRGVQRDRLGSVDEFSNRWGYRRDLVDLYGADTITAPDTQPDATFESASELRADGGESR